MKNIHCFAIKIIIFLLIQFDRKLGPLQKQISDKGYIRCMIPHAFGIVKHKMISNGLMFELSGA